MPRSARKQKSSETKSVSKDDRNSDVNETATKRALKKRQKHGETEESFVEIVKEKSEKESQNKNEVSSKRRREAADPDLESTQLNGIKSDSQKMNGKTRNQRAKVTQTDEKKQRKLTRDSGIIEKGQLKKEIEVQSSMDENTDNLIGKKGKRRDRVCKDESQVRQRNESGSNGNRIDRKCKKRKINSSNEDKGNVECDDNHDNGKITENGDGSGLKVKEELEEKALDKSKGKKMRTSLKKISSVNQSISRGDKSVKSFHDSTENASHVQDTGIKTESKENLHCSNSNKQLKTKKPMKGKIHIKPDYDEDFGSIDVIYRSPHSESKKRRISKVKEQKKTIAKDSYKDKGEIKQKHTSAEYLNSENKSSDIELPPLERILSKPLPSSIDHADVTAVLLHMEGLGSGLLGPLASKSSVESKSSKPSTSSGQAVDDFIMSDDSEESDKNGDKTEDKNNDSDTGSEADWEEVEDHYTPSPKKCQVPDNPVEITLDAPLLGKKRKKKAFDWQAYFQRQMNRFQKNLRIDIHKVHLMCLISHGMYCNRLCNNDDLKAQILSLLPSHHTPGSVKTFSLSSLSTLLKWLSQTFVIKDENKAESQNKLQVLETGIGKQSVSSPAYLAMVCVILLRCLGFLTRLVISLQPLPLKPLVSASASKSKIKGNPAKIQKPRKREKNEKTTLGSKAEKLKYELNRKSKTKSSDSKRKEDKKKNKSKSSYIEDGEDSENSSKKLTAKNKTRRKCASKLASNTYIEEEGDLEDSEEEFVPVEDKESDDSNVDRKKTKRRKSQDTTFRRKNENDSIEISSDSDFEAESIYFPSPKLTRKTKGSQNKKVVSSDSEDSVTIDTSGFDQWVEVYLEPEERWICIDCHTCQLNKPYEIEKKATQPVHYVLAFNNDGTLKDVTSRYASQWLTDTKKFRVESDWFDETLEPYRSASSKIEENEDKEMKGRLIQRPLPTSVAALKSHPLYALQRHLLKFEAIYPQSAIPVGYVRGEPVYARECVHTLHSRENWLKEGRAVRVGEAAYKMVKSRPKWNKPKENPDALDLEIFGYWQTEQYIPPPAVDGKVPRNEYGNVELFMPSMLPAGTVHLQIPGLNKVAKKLGLDCVAAMTGWDHHCGFSHPVLDGWIVCEEFKDTLLAAWDEEQEIMKQKEAEKREKRVYGNWKQLIRGLLIKEKLKKRFNLEEEKAPKITTKKVKKSSGKGEKATDLAKSWPSNRQTEKEKKPSHFEVEKL